MYTHVVVAFLCSLAAVVHAQPGEREASVVEGSAARPASSVAPTASSTAVAEPAVAGAAGPVAPGAAPAAPGPVLAVAVDQPAFAPWSAARLAVELELYAQARWIDRAGDDLNELRLDRGELGARIGLGPRGAAELRVESVRSAMEGGALGIDGDSSVLRVKFAQLAGTTVAGPLRIDGAIGFVPDPWIGALEDGYTLNALSRTASQRLLGWPTSDLAALARAMLGPARLTVSVGNGEGLRYPEQNTGKTTTAVLELVPVHRRALRLAVAAVGRDGSIGVASLRDRRAGGSATVITPWLRGGVEVVRAWGIGDHADAEGVVIGGWAEGRLVGDLFASARGATLGFDAGGRRSTLGGALAIEPWTEATRGRLRVWLALDRVTSSGDAMPLPGADAGDATLVMVIASAIAPFVLE